MDLKGTRAKAGYIVAGLAIVLVVGYWTFVPHRHDPLDSIVADLQKRSIPPAARVLKTSDPERRRFSANASWEIEVDQDWNDYSQGMLERFRDFKIGESFDGKITMFKQLPRDTLMLTIERIGDNPLKIRVSFRGHPS